MLLLRGRVGLTVSDTREVAARPTAPDQSILPKRPLSLAPGSASWASFSSSLCSFDVFLLAWGGPRIKLLETDSVVSFT